MQVFSASWWRHRLAGWRRRRVLTSVERYWGRHTVHSEPFRSAEESRRYLDARFAMYPLFREFMGLYGAHAGETLLDYGCGPGNDVIGFALESKARRIIGLDVSPKALALTRQRLALHHTAGNVSLLQASDADGRIALADASIDYIHCLGVLQHTTHPERILAEFRRVLKPSGRACVMVYNHDSVWLNLYTAYELQVLQGAFPGLSPREAFPKTTDGAACPIARCYTHSEFLSLCGGAGLAGEYRGGYLSQVELSSMRRHLASALGDPRLARSQRDFLAALELDAAGLPLHAGRHAGVGGVYHLHRA